MSLIETWICHGAVHGFLEEYFAALRGFFALPDQTKARIDKTRSPWFRGWERVGTELTDARVDHREQVDIWNELPPCEPGDGPDYLRLKGPNQWPDDDVPGFRPLVERFKHEWGTSPIR